MANLFDKAVETATLGAYDPSKSSMGGLGGVLNTATLGLYDQIFGISAAQDASKAQQQAALAGIDEQRRQFDVLQNLLSPYVQAGSGTQAVLDKDGNVIQQATPGTLQYQLSMLGLGDPNLAKQQTQSVLQGPQYQAMLQQGEERLLQNAAATGGLRGGNTQAALAQFSPQLLAQLLNDRYIQLGGMTTLGQNSATGTGTQAMNMATNVGNLMQQQGAAQAGGLLAPSQGIKDFINTGIKAWGAFK